MKLKNLQKKRCIIFPLDTKAAKALEYGQIYERCSIDVIKLNLSTVLKLHTFGFFRSILGRKNYSPNEQLSFSLYQPHIPAFIDSALEVRKETQDKELLRITDQFLERAKRSINNDLPIWFNI